VAHTFGVAALAGGNQTVMTAVIAAGKTPQSHSPWLRWSGRLCSPSRSGEAGEAAWLLGASFISEGAIPSPRPTPYGSLPERAVTVASSVGLHARPAMIFVQAGAKQPVKVSIAKPGGDRVDARSVLFVSNLDVRTLGAAGSRRVAPSDRRAPPLAWSEAR
jgi:phosphotransferase system HPr (HPr) family protein